MKKNSKRTMVFCGIGIIVFLLMIVVSRCLILDGHRMGGIIAGATERRRSRSGVAPAITFQKGASVWPRGNITRRSLNCRHVSL